jgi:hypothetical protein
MKELVYMVMRCAFSHFILKISKHIAKLKGFCNDIPVLIVISILLALSELVSVHQLIFWGEGQFPSIHITHIIKYTR